MNIPKCTMCGKDICIDDSVKGCTDDGADFYAHEKCIEKGCSSGFDYNSDSIIAMINHTKQIIYN